MTDDLVVKELVDNLTDWILYKSQKIPEKERTTSAIHHINRVIKEAYEKGWKDGLDAAIEQLQKELSHKEL